MQGRSTLRLLILFPRYYWEHKMSSVRRHVIDAILDDERFEAKLSGQGWPDYRDDLPLRDNISRLMPRGCDAIFWYKPLGNRKEEVPPIIEPRMRGISAICAYNEAWWPGGVALKECRTSGTDIVICHHAVDMDQFQCSDGKWNPKVHHVPHCVETDFYGQYAKPWRERRIDVLVTGVLGEEIYPVRTRLAKMVQRGELSGVVIPHPGYRLPSLVDCRKQERRYAALLGSAKVAVVCSSLHRYGLAKYVEAAAAGCILLGDVPEHDFDATLRPHILDVVGLSADGVRDMVEREITRGEGRGAATRAAAVAGHDISGYLYRLKQMVILTNNRHCSA